ncbi:MAG TPA: ATP synthase F1 subunit delta [Gemmatimonadales bacterium]|nr:ATP synthase F1 subunit delta [Gemmatimonadales bacterium]
MASAATIARNYAEALFELGEQHGQAELYGELLDAVAAAVEQSPEAQAVLMSPRVPKAEKNRILSQALAETPREFVLFLQAVVKRGRQVLLREIATAYVGLLDVKFNRVRAGVTVAREPDAALRRDIEAGLSRALGKEVIANFHVDPEILGGTIVRVGERVYDGSLRRRMARLRRQLLAR